MTVSILSAGKFVFSGHIRISEGSVVLDFDREEHKTFFEKVFYYDRYFTPKDGEKYIRALLGSFRSSITIFLGYESKEEGEYCKKLYKTSIDDIH